MNKRETKSVDFFQDLFFSMAIGSLAIAVATFLFGEHNFLQNSPFPALVIVIGLMVWLIIPGRKEN